MLPHCAMHWLKEHTYGKTCSYKALLTWFHSPMWFSFKRIPVQNRRLLQNWKCLIFQIACLNGTSHRVHRKCDNEWEWEGPRVDNVQCHYHRSLGLSPIRHCQATLPEDTWARGLDRVLGVWSPWLCPDVVECRLSFTGQFAIWRNFFEMFEIYKMLEYIIEPVMEDRERLVSTARCKVPELVQVLSVLANPLILSPRGHYPAEHLRCL